MLPEFLKSNFWFVEFNKLDIDKDKKFIVFQILNNGSSRDWEWLFGAYPHNEIKQIVEASLATSWFRQSLGLWQSILGIKAKPSRFSGLPPSNLWAH